jgi:hypothetical protein
MNFHDLHERLRLELVRRIELGDLTGTRLAQQTGFRQGHISNFLNRKRALSLDGLDRVLAAQSLTIDQILPLPPPMSISAAAAPPSQQVDSEWFSRETAHLIAAIDTSAAGLMQDIPIVPPSAAATQPRIHPGSIIESIRISTSLLSENRSRQGRRSSGWQRFVAIRPDAHQAAAMDPLLRPGSVAVIDRCYNSLTPHDAHQPSLFAVSYGPGLVIRYVEFEGDRLLLRPSSISYPIQSIEVAASQTPADYIIGRICLLIDQL